MKKKEKALFPVATVCAPSGRNFDIYHMTDLLVPCTMVAHFDKRRNTKILVTVRRGLIDPAEAELLADIEAVDKKIEAGEEFKPIQMTRLWKGQN